MNRNFTIFFVHAILDPNPQTFENYFIGGDKIRKLMNKWKKRL